ALQHLGSSLFSAEKNGLFIYAPQKPFFNPERIASFSPGLARFREGLPWVAVFTFHNPERVEHQALTKQIQPFQGCDFSVFSPRVARASQPWVESFNPVGIAKNNDHAPPAPLAIPPKTAKNPHLISKPLP